MRTCKWVLSAMMAATAAGSSHAAEGKMPEPLLGGEDAPVGIGRAPASGGQAAGGAELEPPLTGWDAADEGPPQDRENAPVSTDEAPRDGNQAAEGRRPKPPQAGWEAEDVEPILGEIDAPMCGTGAGVQNHGRQAESTTGGTPPQSGEIAPDSTGGAGTGDRHAGEGRAPEPPPESWRLDERARKAAENAKIEARRLTETIWRLEGSARELVELGIQEEATGSNTATKKRGNHRRMTQLEESVRQQEELMSAVIRTAMEQLRTPQSGRGHDTSRGTRATLPNEKRQDAERQEFIRATKHVEWERIRKTNEGRRNLASKLQQNGIRVLGESTPQTPTRAIPPHDRRQLLEDAEETLRRLTEALINTVATTSKLAREKEEAHAAVEPTMATVWWRQGRLRRITHAIIRNVRAGAQIPDAARHYAGMLQRAVVGASRYITVALALGTTGGNRAREMAARLEGLAAAAETCIRDLLEAAGSGREIDWEAELMAFEEQYEAGAAELGSGVT